VDKPRIYVDFNEMVDNKAGIMVLLSKNDRKKDSAGNIVTFYEGMPVSIYSDDEEDGKPDNLIAEGIATQYDLSAHPHWAHVKWCCLIDKNGIRHESDTSLKGKKQENDNTASIDKELFEKIKHIVERTDSDYETLFSEGQGVLISYKGNGGEQHSALVTMQKLLEEYADTDEIKKALTEDWIDCITGY